MNSEFNNQDHQTTDIFRPIREMRSPLSMNGVKNFILDHIEEMTLWQKVQRLILQTGAFTAIIATICCINSPAGETKGGMIIRSANNIETSSFADKSEKQISINARHSIVIKKNDNVILSIDDNASSYGKDNTQSIEVKKDLEQITLTPIAKVEPLLNNPKQSELSELLLPKDNSSSPMRPFAEMQGVAYSGHLRMYGEGIAAGIMHDWQILTLRVMNTSGIHDDRKDAPSLANISRIKKESEQQFALMIGGNIERGRFMSSLQIGPSYGMSQITSGIREVPASNTILNQNMFGVSGEISFGYRVTDFLSANIEGLLNYQSSISGGIMVSIMIQP